MPTPAARKALSGRKKLRGNNLISLSATVRIRRKIQGPFQNKTISSSSMEEGKMSMHAETAV